MVDLVCKLVNGQSKALFKVRLQLRLIENN